jgi:hypothetical protein
MAVLAAATPAGEVSRSDISAARWTIGSIPWDGITLPVSSPDGRHVATYISGKPGPELRQAWPSAAIDPAITVAIFDVSPETSEITERWSLPSGVLLGRSSDAQGFLVEAPTPTGRRIGLAAWETGQITWLTTGVFHDAFGTLSPDGRLAHARWDPAAGNWILRGEKLDGDGWWIHRTQLALIYPTFDATGTRIFAISSAGELTLASLDATGTRPDSAVTCAMGRRASPSLAESMLAGQSHVVGAPDHETALLFFHPTFRQLARWHAGERGPQLCGPDSFSGVQFGADHLIVTGAKDVRMVAIQSRSPGTRIVSGTAVARRTTSKTWPVLLFRSLDGTMLEITAVAIAHAS